LSYREEKRGKEREGGGEEAWLFFHENQVARQAIVLILSKQNLHRTIHSLNRKEDRKEVLTGIY
jgi:hypothetical protein